jgi:hypothetical protein
VQRESGVGDEDRLQFGDGRGERGLVGQQLSAHAGPLRSAPGVDENRARSRVVAVQRAHHPGGMLTGGQGAQPGHGLVALAGNDRAEPGLPGPVMVERVRHLGQGHLGPGAFHPVGQRRRRGGHPLRGLARDDQRRDFRIGRRLRRGCDLLALLEHHVRVRSAESER